MHISVQIIQNSMTECGMHYAEVAHSAGIKLNRFKNLMSGRTRMTMEERDSICLAIGTSPLDIILMRPDIMSDGILDLRAFSPEFRNLLTALADERARESGISFCGSKWKNAGIEDEKPENS